VYDGFSLISLEILSSVCDMEYFYAESGILVIAIVSRICSWWRRHALVITDQDLRCRLDFAMLRFCSVVADSGFSSSSPKSLVLFIYHLVGIQYIFLDAKQGHKTIPDANIPAFVQLFPEV